MSEQSSIGFIGTGKMATALARGFLHAGLVTPASLHGSDTSPEARAAFAEATGASVPEDNFAVVRQASVIFLAVKPAQIPGVLAELKGAIGPDHLVISIAAGVTLSRLQGMLPPGSRVIRVMPNTPALVGASATGFATGDAVLPGDAALAQRLFGAVGVAFEVKEALLDAVTGLSGSGPAYAYLFIEALSDGGVAAGLPRDAATRLAAQTLLGAARMVLETGLHPGALKDMVTSPGGTTIEGLHELERGGVRGAVMSAVRAAADKSRKLGQG